MNNTNFITRDKTKISILWIHFSSRAHCNDTKMQDFEFHNTDNREANLGASSREWKREQCSYCWWRSQRNCHQQTGCGWYVLI